MKYLFILFIAIVGFHCSPKLSPETVWGRGRWVLVEMKGVPVQQSGGARMPSSLLSLIKKDSQVMGVATESAEIIERKKILFSSQM